VTRLIVDYLLCLYGRREPDAWARLMSQLESFAYGEGQSNYRSIFQFFIKSQRKDIFTEINGDEPYKYWRDTTDSFLKAIGTEPLISLSPDYENKTRLDEVINNTKERIASLLKLDSDLISALNNFSEDQAVRILTIHKSKGLEFDAVIIMAIENEVFFGNPNENRCAFLLESHAPSRNLF
jgi:ATP-dependent exoDNAse (exonuclease V) beta subunit